MLSPDDDEHFHLINPEAPDIARCALIYFISDSWQVGSYVKIGMTTNLRHRLKTLQTSSASKLYVQGAIFGCREEEAIIHHYYNHERVNGEWFRLSEDMMIDLRKLFRKPAYLLMDRLRRTSFADEQGK
jgi:hypothetical protein